MSTRLATPGSIQAAPQQTDDDFRRGAWPIYGIVAGVAAIICTHFTSTSIPADVKLAGVEAVYGALGDPLPVRLGASIGFFGLLALVAFAVGYLRFAGALAGEKDLWVSAMRMGFSGSVGALIVTHSLKAMLAGGMPGGIDQGLYTRTDVTVLHLLVDQLQWVGWWGVIIASGCTAGLGLRTKVLPRWIGWFSAVITALVAVLTIGFALPYSAGVVAGLWLVIAASGLAMFRSRVTPGLG